MPQDASSKTRVRGRSHAGIPYSIVLRRPYRSTPRRFLGDGIKIFRLRFVLASTPPHPSSHPLPTNTIHKPVLGVAKVSLILASATSEPPASSAAITHKPSDAYVGRPARNLAPHSPTIDRKRKIASSATLSERLRQVAGRSYGASYVCSTHSSPVLTAIPFDSARDVLLLGQIFLSLSPSSASSPQDGGNRGGNGPGAHL